MTDKQKEVINKIAEIIMKMTDTQLDRCLILGEGMAIMQMLRLPLEPPEQPPQKTA